jgi:hypothetical protein
MRPLLNLLLVFGCLVGIPIAAYHFGNWYYLFGILFWGIGVNVARWRNRWFIFGMATVILLLIANYVERTPLIMAVGFCIISFIIGFLLAVLIMKTNGEYESLQQLNELKRKARKE